MPSKQAALPRDTLTDRDREVILDLLALVGLARGADMLAERDGAHFTILRVTLHAERLASRWREELVTLETKVQPVQEEELVDAF